MNKKEVTEIKKLFTKERCCLNRLCGCYVDADKNKVVQFKEAFLSLPEEEIYKYLDIFRKSLSGTLGKNRRIMKTKATRIGRSGKDRWKYEDYIYGRGQHRVRPQRAGRLYVLGGAAGQ